MVTLVQARNALDAFIQNYGDKEIISIGTYNGTSDIRFELDVADPQEDFDKPHTGRATIQMYEDGRNTANKKEDLKPVIPDEDNTMQVCREMAARLNDDDKSSEEKMYAYWCCLGTMTQAQRLDKESMMILWTEFCNSQFNL